MCESPIYKVYSIFYDGMHQEDISATSKQSVKEYIKDNYKTFLVLEKGVLNIYPYRLKNFKVELFRDV